MTGSRQPLLRAMAAWVGRLVPSFLGPDMGDWGRAVEAEVSGIESDREALQWATRALMGTYVQQLGRQLRRPTAFLPLLMSVASIGMVIAHVALYGVVHESDEGTPAHVFQLLMMAQVPIVVLFAVQRLRAAPVAAANVLLVQVATGCCAVAVVLRFT